MKKKLLKKKIVAKPAVKASPKPAVEKEEPVTKSRGKPRASVCHKCGTILTRESGDNPPLCKCGSQMVKARLDQKVIDKGKLSIEELKTAEAHPKHPERTSRKEALMKEASPSLRLTNFRQHLSGNKNFVDVSNWWELVFPGEDYPEDKSWFLLCLRIEYKLIADANIQDGIALTARQLVNYDGVMDMEVKKLTPLLQGLIKSYDQSQQSKLDRDEARLIKEGKI